ncbi:AgmX/PglI C-terminal domain-containing protein [bacterium]|nr:AgmX/PglI C-terminal domain-containing protein [bacterium]
MKLLTISRNQLEISRAHLRRPVLIIGRSPACDVVLRAPDVEPVHFLLEWIGSGDFDPRSGAWSIVDITRSAHLSEKTSPGEQDVKGDFGEGAVLSSEPVTINDFVFAIVEDRLESSEVIGGQIVESLGSARSTTPELLEVVQVRSDSGAVEEIRHLPIQKKKRKLSILRDPKQFKIEWQGGSVSTDAVLKIILDEMPGAEVSNRGQKLLPGTAAMLKAGDFIRVQWKGRDFYLRLVDAIKAPPIPVDFFGDPLLKKLTIVVPAVVLFLVLVALFWPKSEEPEKPLARVARIEVPEVPTVEPEPPAQVGKTDADEKVSDEQKKPTPKAAAKPKETLKTAPKAGKAAAPKYATQPEAKKNTGLNSPAKVTDVNSVGILGGLKKSAKSGPGVSADKIINEGIVTESVSSVDNSKIVVRNPPAGVLGGKSSGTPGGKGKGLGEAGTTLSGVSKYDPGSLGPVAREGGKGGFHVGDSLSGEGSGLSGTSGIGSLDGGDFSVEGGGLDRETVRRIIQSYRGQVRTCYERALLTKSNLEGRVVYNWTISSDGSVVAADINRATIEHPGLRACVLEVIRRMRFPNAPNGRSTKVIYPFVFQGKR